MSLGEIKKLSYKSKLKGKIAVVYHQCQLSWCKEATLRERNSVHALSTELFSMCTCQYILFSVLLGVRVHSGMAASYGGSIFHLLRNCPTLQRWLHHLSAPPATWEAGSFSLSLPTLVIAGVCDGSGPSGCEAASQPPWLW